MYFGYWTFIRYRICKNFLSFYGSFYFLNVSLGPQKFWMLTLDVGNLISAFTKTNLHIWKFSVHVLLKPGLENFQHYFASVWDQCNYVVVSTFFGIAFLWYWNEKLPFLVLWPLLSFPNLLAYWVQHFNSITF